MNLQPLGDIISPTPLQAGTRFLCKIMPLPVSSIDQSFTLHARLTVVLILPDLFVLRPPKKKAVNMIVPLNPSLAIVGFNWMKGGASAMEPLCRSLMKYTEVSTGWKGT